MKDFLNESKAAFTKEKIEEIVFEYGKEVKGMGYAIDESYTEEEISVILKKTKFFDSKLKELVITKVPDFIVYAGAHDEVVEEDSKYLILGKYKGDFIDDKGKPVSEIYSPIIFMSTPDEKHFVRIFFLDLYHSHPNEEKNNLDFYIPGIFKALNEKGFDIEFLSNKIRNNIDDKPYSDIRVKVFKCYDNNRGILDFYTEDAAKKWKTLNLELIKYRTGQNDIKRLERNELAPRYVEDTDSISTEKILTLMREYKIDFEDVKVNHKGISSIYDTGLFENKNI